MCASRKERSGGVELLVREGLTNKERPDLGIFEEGLFESVFVEIIRGGGRNWPKMAIFGLILWIPNFDSMIVVLDKLH